MSLLSNTCEYGLRAMIYLAREGQGRAVAIRRIARELNAPFHFLAKILQQLGEKGLLVTARGVGGGVALARSADEITVYDVVRAIEGGTLFTACVLGLPGCGNRAPCPMHKDWARQRAALTRLFQKTTLARLARRNARLSGKREEDG